MIAILGVLFFVAVCLFIPVLLGTVTWEIGKLFHEMFQKSTDEEDNGYCRDLQREIAAERNRNT